MKDNTPYYTKGKIGHYDLYSVHAGYFRLDGGAMFGVIPKVLWEKKIIPDDKNHILMCARCLLVVSQKTKRHYLIDCGVGNKENKQFEMMYGINNSISIEDSLQHYGFSANDITDLIFTHLHFDHCGGATKRDDNGHIVYTFPNAQYYVSKHHVETATHPNQREKNSFFDDNLRFLSQHEKLKQIYVYHQFEENFSVLMVNGHTEGQLLPIIKGDGKTLLYAADLIPTHAHVHLPWIMGYDMCARETLKEKEKILRQAVNEKWYLFLEHDPNVEIITIEHHKSKYQVSSTMTLFDI